MEKYFLPSLLLTLLIEVPILFIGLRVFARDQSFAPGTIFFAGVFATFSTLPYLWFVLPQYLHSSSYLWWGEGGVILVEAFIYRRMLGLEGKRALLISAICNLASFFVGGRLMEAWVK
ncbi:MAG: hypothetical protein U1F57_05385 [bacterium]